MTQVAAPVHWPRRTIYIVNHLPGRWPLTSALYAWTRGGSVRLPRAAEAHTGYPCVRLYSSANMSRDWGGFTNRTAPDGVITHARIYMNTYIPDWADWYQRRVWLIHELGHALGLNHDTRRTSVMATATGALNLYTTTYDHALIRNEYTGVRW